MPTITRVLRGMRIAGLSLLALIVFFSTYTVIPAGERGVVLTWGAISRNALDEGLHFVIPFVQTVQKVKVSTQTLEVPSSEAYSRDLQVVSVHSVLNWNIEPAYVNDVYRELQGGERRLQAAIVAPNLEVAIKQVVAKYTSEELLEKRQEVQDNIAEALRQVISENHVRVTHYALVDESFSEAYEAAIERKQIAEQDALAAKNKLEQVKFEADQRVTQAEAEAKAIKIQAEAITQQGGTNYVQLKAVEQWNGILPQYMTSGAPLPFLNLTR